MTAKAQHLVVLSAGRGTRLGAAGAKCLVEVGGRSLLDRLLVLFASEHGVAALPIVVLGPQELARDAGRVEGSAVQVLVQEAPTGVVDAMLLTLPHLAGDPLFVLGDIALEGSFAPAADDSPGLFTWRAAPAAAVRANFGVATRGHRVLSVVEKPAETGGLHCGLGVYAFDAGLVRLLGEAPRGLGGEREITASISFALARGVRIVARAFDGWYVNVNAQDDLARARRLAASSGGVISPQR